MADRQTIVQVNEAARGPRGIAAQGPQGNPGANVMAVGLFTGLSAQAIPNGTDLIRTSGHSTVGVGVADYTYDATVDAAYVAANPYSSFRDVNGRGFRLSTAQQVTAFMFGTAGDDTITDDYARLQAFATFVATKRCPHLLSGLFSVSAGLLFDPGVLGVSSSFHLNLGYCRLTARNAISRMFMLQDGLNTNISGRLHARGTNYLSDNCALWTCDVAVWLNGAGLSETCQLYAEGFGFAAVHEDLVGNPHNDSIHFKHIAAVRVGAGQPVAARNITANFSGAARVGVVSSVTQTTTANVDTLPIAYVTPLASGAPTYPVRVEVNGNLHWVTNIDPVGKVLTLFPWLPGNPAAGTLKYHYGAVLVTGGADGQIPYCDYISAVACSAGVHWGTLYGGVISFLHTETCGSSDVAGAGPGSTIWGVNILERYCEGNTFNHVHGSRACTQYYLGPAPATSPASKDVDMSIPLTGSEIYGDGEGFVGLTIAGPSSGSMHRKKRFADIANETIDFTQPRTFESPLFYSANAAVFSLIPPDSGYRKKFGQDCARIGIMGSGVNGQPTSTITINVPTTAYTSCVTTNGSAVVTMASTKGLFAGMPITGTGIPAATTILSVDSATQITLSANATASGTVTLTVTNSINGAFANFVCAANSFSGPAGISIYYDGGNKWTIGTSRCLSATAVYDPPSLAAGASSPIQVLAVTGAVLGDGVNMAFSNSLAGAELKGYVSAANTVSYYFTNTNGANPLDLGSGTVTARIIR